MQQKRTIADTNFRHLIWEVAWFGVAWVTVTRFLSVYAVRLGATPTELAWISAGPPIGMLLSSLVSVWWRDRHPDSIHAVEVPTVLFRLNFLLLALTPLFPTDFRPIWLILAVTLPAVPQGIAGIIFIGVLKESTPSERMTSLLARRTLTINLSLGVGAVAFGLLLETLPFPMNYTVMFSIGFCGAMLSYWHVHNLKPVTEPEPPTPSKITTRDILAQPVFRRVILTSVIGHIAFFSVSPILVLHLIDGLGASEGFMATFSAVELAGAALVALVIGRIVARLGNRGMVGVALFATGLAALVVGLAPSLPVALGAAALTGAGWSTSEIGLIGYLTENTPVRDGARFTRTYSQFVWSALFIAPFIGTTLAEIGIPLTTILVAGFVVRAATSAFIFFDAPQVRERLARVSQT